MGIRRIINTVMGDKQPDSSAGAEEFAIVNIDDPSASSHSAQSKTPNSFHDSSPQKGFSWPQFSFCRHKAKIPEQLLLSDDEDMRMINANELMKFLGIYANVRPDGRIDSYSLLDAAHRLEKMGLAMMPDGRCPFRVKSADEIAVYRAPEGMQLPLTYRSVQQTVIYLAAWLVQSDGASASDLHIIDSWIDAHAPKDRSSLPQKAMLRWLLSRKRILSKRVKTRASSQMARFVHKREAALELIFSLATAGEHSHLRIKNLEKLFPLFGLDPKDVHVELHRRSTASASPGRMKSDASLDKLRLQAMEQNTSLAQEILHSVFSVDEPLEAPDAEVTNRQPPKTENIAQTLYNKVIEREKWSIDDFASLVAEYGLSPMAALENINDYAYEHFDEPVLEEDGDSLIVVK